MRISTTIIAAALALTAAAVPAKRTPFTVTQPDGTTLTLRQVGDERLHFLLTDDDKLVIRDADGTYSYATLSPDGAISSTRVRALNAVARPAAHDELATSLESVDIPDLLFKRAKLSRPHVRNFKLQTPVQQAVTPYRRGTNTSVRRPKPLAASNASASALPATSTQPYAQKGMGLFTSTFPRTGKIKGLVLLVEYQDVKFNGYYSTSVHQYFSDLLNKEGFAEYNATGSAAQYFRENSMGQFDPEFVVVGPVTLSQTRAYYGTNNSFGDDEKAGEMIAEACQLADSQVNFADFDNDGDGVLDNVFVFYAGTGEASGGPAESIWPHSWTLTEAKIDLTLDGKKIDSYACTNELQSGLPDGIGTFVHEFSHVMGLPDLYVTSGFGGEWTPGEYSVMDYGPYNNDSRTPPAYSAYERNAMGWLDPQIVTGGVHMTLDDIKYSNTAMLIATERPSEFFLFENRQQRGWDEFIPGHGMLIWHIDFKQDRFDANNINNTKSHNLVDIVEANGTPGSNKGGYTWPGTQERTEFTAETSPAFLDWYAQDLNMPVTEIVEQNGKISFNVRGGTLLPPAALEPLDKGSDYFVAAWDPVDGATDYLLTVLGTDTKQPPFEDLATMGSSAVSAELPTGWTTDATGVYTDQNSVGSNAPSLMFDTDNQYIESRHYDSDITYVSFWSACPDSRYYTSTFTTYALVNGEWEMQYVVSPARNGATTRIDLPEGSRAVRIVYNKGAASLALDDVKVHSDGVCDRVLDGYNGLSSGGAMALRVNTEGLPYDIYRYYVRATDGQSVSMKSADVTVKMDAGVNDIVSDNDVNPLTVSANGTTLNITAAPGARVHVFDAVGRPVAAAHASVTSGAATLTVPASGFYIVTSRGHSAKIAVRH